MSDSHMSDAPAIQGAHPSVNLERIMTQDEADAARNLALILQAEFDEIMDGYQIQEDDMPAIIKNPNAFDLNRRGVTVVLAKEAFLNHKLLAKHFLSYSLKGEKALKLRKGQPNLKATRNETMSDQARARDGFRCNLLKNSFPHMAHVYPFSATGTTLAVLETGTAFSVTETLISRRFYLKWCDCASQLGGFEDRRGCNVFAFNPYAHTLLDNGVIGLRYLGPGQDRDDGKCYAKVMVLWLPVCTNLTDAKANLDHGADDTVTRLFNEVETAFAQRFLPRRPANGTGSIWLCFDDGTRVRSGHTFEVGFFEESVRDDYGEMITVSYEVMLQLTLRGKTKGLPPIPEGEEDDGDNDGHDSHDGDNDNGRGKTLSKGKGKERASSPARDPSPRLTSGPSTSSLPRLRRASRVPRPISRSTAGSPMALSSSPVRPPASGPSTATRSTSSAYRSTIASRARSTVHRHDPLTEGRGRTDNAAARRRSVRLQQQTGPAGASGSGSNDK